MKPIFKTSAIFACLALMLVACDRELEEDTTEYSGVPIVGTSDIWALSPGNGKFEIEWDVTDNSIVTGCYLTWSDGGENVGERVFTSDDEDYKIAPLATINYVVEDLAAGTYSVTLVNTSDVDIITSTVSKSVTVFDSSTYSETVDVAEVIHNGKDVEVDITTTLPDDCVGIIATYTKGGVSGTVSDLLAYDAFTTTAILPGADAGTTFTYVACFQPDNAMDSEYVKTSGTATQTVPQPSPLQPASIVVNAGDRRAIITWEVENSDYFAGSQITYTNSIGTETTLDLEYSGSVETPEVDVVYAEVGTNTYELTGLTGGETYTIGVRNYSYDSSDKQYLSRVAEESGVAPYDYAAYESSCALPTLLLEKVVNGEDTYLSVSFIETSSVSCRSIDFTYEYQSYVSGQTNTTTITDLSEPILINNALAGGNCSFVATFALPDNALDDELSLPSATYLMDCLVTYE